MTRPIIYLAAPASPAGPAVSSLGLPDGNALIEQVQQWVGDAYLVRGRPAILDAREDDRAGGRADDAARVRELHAVLGDDRVAALIAVRGGGWLVRLLPDLDLSVLNRRTRPISIFGFSEITPLINLVGLHRRGRGYYYMTPVYPYSAMDRYARIRAARLSGRKGIAGKQASRFARRWANERAPAQVRAYFQDVIRVIEKQTPSRQLTGRLVQGRLPDWTDAVMIGGCLSLVTPLTAATYTRKVDPAGRWIVLEDLNETPHRMDRQFAHLKVAGWFERCAGVVLGDFHHDDQDQSKIAQAILKYHLPKGRQLPVIHAPHIGHTWPNAMLPIGKRVRLRTSKKVGRRPTIRFEFAWGDGD